MERTMKMRTVLQYLATNVKENTSPELVDSKEIAEELQLSIEETKQLLKAMSQMGVIESDSDTQHNLITQSGMSHISVVL